MDPSALLFLMELPNPPVRPTVVEERLILSKGGEQVQKVAERSIAGYRTYVEDWIRRIAQAKAQYDAIPLSPLGESESKLLDEFIEEIEALADFRARGLEAFRKKSARDLKRVSRLRDQSFAAVARDTARKLDSLDERVLHDLLDYALFLRAARAERTPNNDTIAVFSDAGEARAFLKRNAA